MDIVTRLFLHDGQQSPPRTGLLLYLRTPNGTGAAAGKYVATAGSASIFAALGSDWYTDVATPKALTAAEILALASVNDYHILFSAAKGLAIYDPYTTTQVTIDKAHRFYKATVYQDDVPTAFFNGLDFTNATYTGGPTIVADNTGALVNAGANKPGVMGARLDGSIWYDTALDGTPIVASTSQPTRVCVIASTIAEGATLGQELVVDCTASKWTALGSNTVEQDGDAVKITYVDNSSGAKYFLKSSNMALLAVSLYAARLYITFRAKINSGTANARVQSDSSSTSFTFENLTTEFVEYSVEFKNRDELRGYWNITFFNFGPNEVIWVKDVSVKIVYPTYIAPFFTPGTTFKRYSSANPTTMPGWLCEPARTNYALNSASPATHTIANIAAGTYTLWQEGSGSIAATAGTAVGTFGTASNETPARITITAGGTVVLTASGTNTWVQLELGAFKTSRITTTAESATRAGTVCTYNTAGVIRGNDMAMLIRCTPRAAGQTAAYLWGCYNDTINSLSIVLNPSNITLRKRINGINTDATVSYTHAADTPIEVLCVFSTAHGMRVAVRAYSGGVWGAWTNGTTVTTTAAKTNAVIASTFQRGALNGASQFAGNISEDNVLLLPDGIPDPLAYVKAKLGVA